ncbi:T7SS effector LXG polymorphic toxin [Streptococcus dentapri]|uniref:T7SS effector LXG polymorphic toxin n=1 Tax=Streptococcus dentapri TaxID=573564 RepID=A0ABV8D2H6_9STRE
MGFHVEMAEVKRHLETLQKEAKATSTDLEGAKKATNKIIQSGAMYGQTGEVIYNQLNNYDAALAVSMMDALTLLPSEFSQAVSDFQTTVKETNDGAILDEDYLTQLGTKLDHKKTAHTNLEKKIATIYDGISDIVQLDPPKSHYDRKSDNAKKVLTYTVQWVNQFDSAKSASSTESLLEADSTVLGYLQQIAGLAYTDPTYSQFVGNAQFGEAIHKSDTQIKAAIKKAEKEAKAAAEKVAKKKEADWKKHHPIQNFFRGLKNWAVAGLEADAKKGTILDKAVVGALEGAVTLLDGVAEGAPTLSSWKSRPSMSKTGQRKLGRRPISLGLGPARRELGSCCWGPSPKIFSCMRL